MPKPKYSQDWSSASKPGASGEKAERAEQSKPAAQRTRARNQLVAPLDKTSRVREIVKLMSSGMWVTGVTGGDLAEQWGVAESTLERDIATARDLVRGAVCDIDEIRARIMATLETITARSMESGQMRTAVEAIRTLAGVTGAEAPKQVNVGGNLSELLALGLGSGSEEPPKPLGE